MGRALRAAAGGLIYHVLNRANHRRTLFEHSGDYEAFERVLAEAQAEYPVPLLCYCLMPNHWHLMLAPAGDGDLSRFVGWLTLTHTQRLHAHRHTTGSGHVYQGRFKSFAIEADEHLRTVCRHVERNPLRAGLVERAELWRWGSLWRRGREGVEPAVELAEWPGARPADWVEWVNAAQTAAEEEALRRCVRRGQPFGREEWVSQMVGRLGLAVTMRSPGRPRKIPSAGPWLPFPENGS